MKKLVNKSFKCIMILMFIVFAGTSGIAYAKAPGFDDAEILMSEYSVESDTTGSVNCTVESGGSCSYYFILGRSGRLDISLKDKCETIWQSVSFKLCDANGDVVYSTEVAAGQTFSNTFYLIAGDYYVQLSTIAEFDAQECELTYKYTSSGELGEWLVSDEFKDYYPFDGKKNRNNNSFANAEELGYDRCYEKVKIKGQFGYKDSKDYYKVEIPTKGKLTFKYSSEKKYAEYIIYKGKKEVASGRLYDDKSLTKTLNVSKGTYYILLYYGELTGTNNDADDGGFYSFSIKYKNTKAVKGECKVEYKGKTIVVCSVPDIYNSTTPDKKIKDAKYSEYKKKWGTNAKSEKSIKEAKAKGSALGTYELKKGKSRVEVTGVYFDGKLFRSSLRVYINDKNMIANGVKVGTSKAKAIKILKKRFGADSVYYKDGKIKVYFKPYVPLEYTIKNGKVASFAFFHS